MTGLCFVMWLLVSFCNHLTEEERAGIVFLMSCDCVCSVSLLAVGGGGGGGAGIFLVFS